MQLDAEVTVVEPYVPASVTRIRERDRDVIAQE
jgi:hypothetical protein